MARIITLGRLSAALAMLFVLPLGCGGSSVTFGATCGTQAGCDGGGIGPVDSSVGGSNDSGGALDGTSAPDAGGEAGASCPLAPIHCSNPSDCPECTGGQWVCIACSSEPDASSDASDGAPCPAAGCGAGQVCVNTTSCRPVCLADAGFSCPAGATQNGCCCEQSVCETLPAACDGTLTCACASSLCTSGYMCGVDSQNADTLDCSFLPP
ncbi:MAG: hypothetical protein ACLQBL_16945 [Polyangiaceae bacterium]